MLRPARSRAEQALDPPARRGGGPAAASSATSAAGVRSTSIASSARSSGSTRCGGGVELLARQRRQRAVRRGPPRAAPRTARRACACLSTSAVGARRRARRSRAPVASPRCRATTRGGRAGAQDAAAQRQPSPSPRYGSSSTMSGALRATSSSAVLAPAGGADRHEAGLGAQQHRRARREWPAGGRRWRCGSRHAPSQPMLKTYLKVSSDRVRGVATV